MTWGGFGLPKPPFVGHSRNAENNKKRRLKDKTMRFTYSEQGNTDFTIYEAGVYSARLTSWADAGESSYKGGPLRQRLRLNWTFLDEQGKPTDQGMPSWVGASLGPKSTLKRVAEALLGQTLEEGFELELDDLLDHDCQLSVSVGQREDGKGETNKILAYSPLVRRAPVARQAGGSARPQPAPARQPVAASAREDDAPF